MGHRQTHLQLASQVASSSLAFGSSPALRPIVSRSAGHDMYQSNPRSVASFLARLCMRQGHLATSVPDCAMFKWQSTAFLCQIFVYCKAQDMYQAEQGRQNAALPQCACHLASAPFYRCALTHARTALQYTRMQSLLLRMSASLHPVFRSRLTLILNHCHLFLATDFSLPGLQDLANCCICHWVS